MKPSDVKDIIPQMSTYFDFQRERVANWTAQALAATGDTWREITWEEIEPLIKEWGESDRRMFKKLLPVLDSEERARHLSPFWDIKKINRVEEDDERQKQFLKDFQEIERGQIRIAERTPYQYRGVPRFVIFGIMTEHDTPYLLENSIREGKIIERIYDEKLFYLSSEIDKQLKNNKP